MRAPTVLPGSGLKTIEENNSRAETALHVPDMFKGTHTVGHMGKDNLVLEPFLKEVCNM